MLIITANKIIDYRYVVQIKITYNKSSFALGHIQHIPNESALKFLALTIIINTDSGLKILNSRHSIQDTQFKTVRIQEQPVIALQIVD